MSEEAGPGPDGAGPGPGGDRGFVTAETAVVLPVLVAFAMALVWALLAASAQIQCVDAARVGARAAARQDPPDAVEDMARAVAPHGARVSIGRTGDLVHVIVVAKPLGAVALPFEVRHEAVAEAEETGAGTAGTAGGDGGPGAPAGGTGATGATGATGGAGGTGVPAGEGGRPEDDSGVPDGETGAPAPVAMPEPGASSPPGATPAELPGEGR
jgi:hypothetical protein